MRDERLEVRESFDERCGYIGTAPELRQPVTALSLGGLRRDRRRAQAQLSRVLINRDCLAITD
jgi:hypothetical protein